MTDYRGNGLNYIWETTASITGMIISFEIFGLDLINGINASMPAGNAIARQ